MVIFRRIKMSAPFFTHMAQRYRSPQNFKNQSKTYGKRPHPGFQWRPHAQFGPVNNSTTESNDEHWCETCDRGFPTADLLEQHKQQHQVKITYIYYILDINNPLLRIEVTYANP